MSSDGVKDLAKAERERYEEERDTRDEERRILEAIEHNTANAPQYAPTPVTEAPKPGFASRFGLAVAGSMRRGSSHVVHHITHSHLTLLFLVIAFGANLAFVILGGKGNLFDGFWLAVYLCIALFAFFVVYPSDGFDGRRLLLLILFSFVAYLFPFGVLYWKDHAIAGIILNSDLARFLAMFFPLWLLYILSHEQEGATRAITTILLIGWIFYLFSTFLIGGLAGVDQAHAVLLSPGEAWDAIMKVVREGVQPILSGGKKLATQPTVVYNDTKNFFKGQIGQATQEYYVGQVDSTEGQPVGVFISDLQPLHTKFYIGTDDVIVDGVLKARTFTDSIAIDNKCYLEYTEATLSGTPKKVDGAVSPKDITVLYTGEFQDKYDVECTVAKDKISSIQSKYVSGTVVFNSTFSFETLGYAEYGFMDQQLVQAFRRENTDPAQVLGIPRIVTPKYTPGPVMIGMSTDTLPIAYDSTQLDPNKVRLPTFGVTISNSWAGKGNIQQIKTVHMYLPKPFLLDTGKCTPDGVMANVARESWKDNERYNQYTITVAGNSAASQLQLREKELYTTIRCPLQLDADAAKRYPVLGTSGAGIYTFFADVTYDYALVARSPVVLQKDAGGATS